MEVPVDVRGNPQGVIIPVIIPRKQIGTENLIHVLAPSVI